MTDEPESYLWLRVTEDHARALLRNEIPEDVKAMCRCAVDWEWTLAQNIAKPIYQPKKRKPSRGRG